MRSRLPLILALLAVVVGGESPSFASALDKTFAMQSSSVGASNNEAVTRSVTALMVRHGIPTNAAALRNASDERLTQLAMVAAVGSISSWRRSSEGHFLLDERGALVHMHSAGAVESDIMMCIVCALLAVVVMFHIVAVPPQQPAAGDGKAAAPKK